MENHALDPIMVLKVKINCCKECPEKLKKALLEMKGVHQVTLDPENNRVCITGDRNPFKLVKALAKWGKYAELVFYNKEPMNEDNCAQNHHKNEQKSKDKIPNSHCQNVEQNDPHNRGKHSFSDDHDDDGDDEHEDYVHNHKYRARAAANEVEEERNWDRYGRFHNTDGRQPSRKTDHINHPHQHKAPSPQDIQAFIKQAEEDMRRMRLCRQYWISRSRNGHAPRRY